MMSDRSRWSANIKLIHLIFFLSLSSISILSRIYIRIQHYTQWEMLINSTSLECCKGFNSTIKITQEQVIYTRENKSMYIQSDQAL